MTVLDTPLSADYDLVLAHEHLLIDIRSWADTEHPLYRSLEHVVVDDDTVADVRRHPFACLDNLLLDDEDVARDELARLDGARVLVVDVTPDHLGGDAQLLARLSADTGVDIVRGCGAYVQNSWPASFKGFSADQFADRIRAQFDTARPPAVIGEIGTSSPITEAEIRSLAGAARAQAELGVPLYVHLHPWSPEAMAALDVVERAGGDVERTVLCHLDVTTPRAVDRTELALERGCYVAFDIWGDEFAYGGAEMPSDLERARATAELCDRGWGHRLVHSQDVCTKTQLRRHGGAGYAHLLDDVPGLLAAAGLSPAEVRDQLSGNALELLGIVGPRPRGHGSHR